VHSTSHYNLFPAKLGTDFCHEHWPPVLCRAIPCPDPNPILGQMEIKSHLVVRRPFARFECGEISELAPLRIEQAEYPKPAVRPADDPTPPPASSRRSFYSPAVLHKEVGITGYHPDQPRMRSGPIIPACSGTTLRGTASGSSLDAGIKNNGWGAPCGGGPAVVWSLGRFARPRE
jgi:hypothetical protein